MMIYLLLILLSSFFFTGLDSPPRWQRLRPGESTCKDVESLFRGHACGGRSVTYEEPTEIITFVFSVNKCSVKWPYELYNLPTGTITEIIVIPRDGKTLTISELEIPQSKLRKRNASDSSELYEYESKSLGLRFTATAKDVISEIHYFPASRFDDRLCNPQPARTSQRIGAPRRYW